MDNAFSLGSASMLRFERLGFSNFAVSLGANLVLAGKTSSPSSFLRIFIMPSCTSNMSLDGFSSALVAPMMIKRSSFTECPVSIRPTAIFSNMFFFCLYLLTFLVHMTMNAYLNKRSCKNEHPTMAL